MSKKKRKRRKFTDEYKAEVVRLCQQPGKTPNGVANELGLTPSAVMGWVRQRRPQQLGQMPRLQLKATKCSKPQAAHATATQPFSSRPHSR
jgi:transposase-like protein